VKVNEQLFGRLKCFEKEAGDEVVNFATVAKSFEVVEL
jgi:hypothetical protein